MPRRRGSSPRPSSRRAPRRARGPRRARRPTARPDRASPRGGRACRPTGRSRSASPIAWTWAASSASKRSRTSTGSTSAPSAAKCSTPIEAQRCEDLLAVGPGRRRQDRDAGPAAAGRGEQARVDLAHRGQELARPDEGDRRPGMRREHIRACATLPTHDPHPTLDPAGGDRRLGDRLPRQHRREPRPEADRPGAPDDARSASSRARPTSAAATSPSWRPC